jgi:predicted ATPase
MIKSLEIKNFRCFRKIEVTGLNQVNVLVGANGSGKTTFLEALFLASGASPELALRLRSFRGMGTSIEIPSEGLEALWKNLFHDFDQRKTISIDLIATNQESRHLTVSLGSSEELRLPLRSLDRPQILSSAVEFSWRDASGRIFKSRPTVSEDRLSFPQDRTTSRAVFVPSSFRLSPEEAAKRLSTLSRKNESEDLAEILRSVYPDVEDISVENSDGNWEVFAKVAHLSERLPMALYSAGASRLVAIALSITAVPNGVVLIDELENGFYYQSLTKIWRVLSEMARSYKCQLFVSTHSQECLRALSDLDESELAHSFALLNVQSASDGSRVAVSTGEVMASAIQSGFEVR